MRLLLLLTLLLLGAGPAPAADSPGVRIAAAASLREVLDDIGREFEKTTGVRILATYAATSALARQVEAAAPFDIFISADEEWMDYLSGRSLTVQGTSRIVATNQLVLIAPRNARPELKALRIAPDFPVAAALGDRRLAMASPDVVPAGKYARAALTALGVWPALEARLARAENVRAALMFVARGESPLGIVYRTDALAEPGVHIVDTFDPKLHPAIVYPAALVRGHGPRGADFLAFITSPAAHASWRRYGFGLPR